MILYNKFILVLLLALAFEVLYFSKNQKKIFWKTLLVLGIIPFAIALLLEVYYAITGFSGLCFRGNFYGFKAFGKSIILYSYNFYPNYLLGIILIILAILKLRKS